MFHRLIDVLSMKPVHSFHMAHLPRTKKHCWSMSHVIQSQPYPWPKTWLRNSTSVRVSKESLWSPNPPLSFWELNWILQQISFSPLFRARCSKWMSHNAVKQFFEEAFDVYLDLPMGTKWGFEHWACSSFILLFSPQ